MDKTDNKNTAVQDNASTDTQQENTQQQAVNVDTEAITKKAEEKAVVAAEKKMEAVFKSMLQQQGFDAEAINKMTEEWKKNQSTPEKELEEAKGLLAGKDKEIVELNEKLHLATKSIPEEKSQSYLRLARSYMDEQTDFATALDKALEDFPVKLDKVTPQIQFDGNPKNSPQTKMTKKEIMEIKDSVKRQEAISQNIELFT